MNSDNLRNKIRSIALSIVFVSIGYMFVLLLTKLMGIELSKVQKGLVIFLFTTILSLALFPKVFKIPFGKQTIVEWLSSLGFYLPQKFTRHILLGVLLGAISLSGMLIASLVTGKYEFDLSNLSPGHFIFCLTPGIWEEIFFRGVIMMVLISMLKSIRKAFWWQVFIFAICHFKSLSIEGGIEMVSVFIIGITYTLVAVKTRCLIAGIISHYIHDAFLYLVQNPDGEYHGLEDQFTFYIFLWTAMLINIIIINLAADVLKIKGNKRIYAIDDIDDNFTLFQPKKQTR
jgi:membrane protease YdiL (CAAX protease family)